MHPVQAAPRQRDSQMQTPRPSCDAPRAGSAEAKGAGRNVQGRCKDAPRAGSAEAKGYGKPFSCAWWGCTPCRQRRGKGADLLKPGSPGTMHPVQAAPRQRGRADMEDIEIIDAPRAGSAKRNSSLSPDGPLTTGRHFFTFHPSRIPTVGYPSSVTMYNPDPIFLTDPAWQSRISPTVPMLSVTGRPRGYEVSGGSPWG